MNAIPKEKLILHNTPNILNYPQSTLDTYLVDDFDRSNIIRMVTLLIHRMNHFSTNLMGRKIEAEFPDVDFVRFLKYPLIGAYNKKTDRLVVNIQAIGKGKKEITNIDTRALYSAIFYVYLTKLFTKKPLHLRTQIEVSDFLSDLLMKVFGKRYGIMASYKEMIPRLRFITISYVLTSFYGQKQTTVYAKATRGGVSRKDFQIDFNKYDLYSVKDFIKALSDSSVFPGIDLPSFVETLQSRFRPADLNIVMPFFEDEMRFMAVMGAASMPTGGLFPPYLETYNQKLYRKILMIIESLAK